MQKMHEKEDWSLKLIAVNTFMQRTESLSLSALIMWTNQCLLGWIKVARPQCKLDDKGTQSAKSPPTLRKLKKCEETSTWEPKVVY